MKRKRSWIVAGELLLLIILWKLLDLQAVSNVFIWIKAVVTTSILFKIAFADSVSDPFLDPLSKQPNHISVTTEIYVETDPVPSNQISESNQSWNQKKQQIMKDYSVDGSITFSSSTIGEVYFQILLE